MTFVMNIAKIDLAAFRLDHVTVQRVKRALAPVTHDTVYRMFVLITDEKLNIALTRTIFFSAVCHSLDKKANECCKSACLKSSEIIYYGGTCISIEECLCLSE